MTANKTRHIHVDELKKFGFSDSEIQEAVTREARGLYETEPAADLVERTIKRCKNLFPQGNHRVNHQEAEDLASRVRELAVILPLVTPALASHYKTLCSLLCNYADSLAFSMSAHERPFMILENHNMMRPACWTTDIGFNLVRDISRQVNAIVASKGIKPAARLVILRPKLEDYEPDDLEAIKLSLKSSNSDIWWLPCQKAAAYSNRDLTVVGNARIFEIKTPTASPWEALGAMDEHEDLNLAMKIRKDIEKNTARAVPIKTQGKLRAEFSSEISIEDVRGFLKTVISRKSDNAL